jgi:putative spermidine/putrescine transport system substrate-binding protein
MPARTLLAAVALLAASISCAAAHDLTVVSRGPGSVEPLRRVFVQAFAGATAIAVRQENRDDGIEALETQLKAPDNEWDLVELRADELAAACADGLLEKLDFSAIGGKDHYLPQGVSDCGVGATVSNIVLAWDRDKFPATPTWADFWDIAKYPGKRGLYRGPRGNLEIALIADGVAPGDVYRVLATADGVDRAFRKLDQLKPYLVWWDTDADAERILSSGDVLMTSAPSDRIAVAARNGPRDFGMQWTASLGEVQSWAIVKGSPNLRQAMQFLYFAGTPAIEGRLLEVAGASGLAKNANDLLPPDLVAVSPTSPANLAAAIRFDGGFWRDNLAKLGQRFDAWLAQH